MKTKLALKVSGLIGVLALISALHCFYRMTVPLSYDRVYLVVAGFIVALLAFASALISSFVCVIRLRRSTSSTANPVSKPMVR